MGQKEDKVKKPKEKKAASGGGLTMDEVAKHTTKEDCWVVLHNRVLNVTSFLSQHPGGELAILTWAGKDASAEFDMIHPPDVIEKYAPDAVIGQLGAAGGAEDDDDDDEDESDEEEDAGGGGGYTAEEVAKHTTKEDCWVILHGNVLNVTSFLSQHPGGELAILTFAGKDATAEFDMIHPPDVVGKYAPDAIIGSVGAAKAKKAPKKGKKGADAGPKGDIGSAIANHQYWGTMQGADNWRVHLMDEPIGFLGFAWAYAYAGWALLLSVLYEVCATIFSATNIKITNDRVGLTRSAIFLIIFIIIHAVGNLHVFKGPDDFNGYGYFYVRLYWTGFGLPANIVEEYVLLSILLHVAVGLKRTWDQKLAMVKTSGLSVLNLAITGLMLMTFMTIHLFQFRFGDTDKFGPYYIRPPPFFINFEGILALDLFWAYEGDVKVGVRDIYALEFDVFKNPVWAWFYTWAVILFVTHACLGWKKVTPVLVPKRHVTKSEHIGFALIIVVGLIYLSFPLYVWFSAGFAGYETSIQDANHTADTPGA